MTDEWATPQALFDKLNEEFHFQLDVCATTENHKCHQFYTREDDGLRQDWNKWFKVAVWMNPPYGKTISQWMQKAYETAQRGATVVCLIPNRSNAPWWHEWVMKSHEIRFVVKKVPFTGPVSGVPFFGSCIIVFDGPRERAMPKVSSYKWRK